MDDQRFDDSIKSKVGEYEAPGFDPTALAALHHQMAAASVVPWYLLYRTELLVGTGLLASTLIILWSQWFLNSNTSEALNEKITALQAQQAEIGNLKQEILTLKNVPPDTIRIIEIREQPSSDYTSLLYRIRLLEAESASGPAVKEKHSVDAGNIAKVDYQNSPFNTTPSSGDQYTDPKTSLYGNPFSSRLSPRIKEKESLHAKPDSSAVVIQSNSKKPSAKTLRDLENHYQKGVGIRVGPALEIAKGLYDRGNGEIGIGGGILADFILSPSLSVETGLKYAHRVYDISKEGELSSEELPGMDQSLGTLKKIDIDSWIFEIPLNLKYRYPVSTKAHWLAGLGYSSIIYGKQVFEYEYSMGSNPDVTINSDYTSSQVEVYPGALNFSLGLSNRLKNKKMLETSIYYQLGLGKTGLEENSVNYLGVRGVYWFTLR